jgi:hypothetical protein
MAFRTLAQNASTPSRSRSSTGPIPPLLFDLLDPCPQLLALARHGPPLLDLSDSRLPPDEDQLGDSSHVWV